MKIGNIVTNEKIDDDNIFNIVNEYDKCISGIPTLIVGYDLVKEIFPNIELNFLNRKINDNLFWTFTKKEERNYNINDVYDFKNLCYKLKKDEIKYIFIDPIQFKLSKIKKIINKIKSSNDLISFFYRKKMIYLYTDKIIFGIDNKLLNYIGINVNKLNSRIYSISSVTLNDSEILIEYNKHIERLSDEVKYVPYLYSILNNE